MPSPCICWVRPTSLSSKRGAEAKSTQRLVIRLCAWGTCSEFTGTFSQSPVVMKSVFAGWAPLMRERYSMARRRSHTCLMEAGSGWRVCGLYCKMPGSDRRLERRFTETGYGCLWDFPERPLERGGMEKGDIRCYGSLDCRSDRNWGEVVVRSFNNEGQLSAVANA